MPDFAQRLVNDLMLVSVLVAGPGAPPLAAALAGAGAAADVWDGTQPQGYDLTILLAAPGDAAAASTRTLLESAGQASERLLFVPLRSGHDSGPLPELAAWFELFVEQGFQPVVDFDASYAAEGAFLVDREAVAGEAELAAFATRLQLGENALQASNLAASRAAPDEDTAREALRVQLEASEAALAAARAQLAEASAAISDAAAARAARDQAEQQAAAARARQAALEADHQGWEALRAWVRLSVSSAEANSMARLARDWTLLVALRPPGAPPLDPPGASRAGFWSRLRGAAPPAHPVLEAASLVRGSQYFDAAWYIASQPELAAGSALDPAFHYVMVGALLGADPGPWFDSASYVAAHPDAAGAPLLHAIAHKKQ